MIKFLMKGFIFVLGIQSFMGHLQRQNIIEGEIKINYDVLQEKIVTAINSQEVNDFVRKIKESDISEYVVPAANGREIDYNRRDSYQEQDTRRMRRQLRNKSIKLCRHVVRNGDTLSELAQSYGVSWKVIKKANNINDERRLRIGQDLVIPTQMA